MKMTPTSAADAAPFQRDEIVRLMLQCMSDLNLSKSKRLLEEETGCLLETPAIQEFKQSILSGDWDRVEHIMLNQFLAKSHSDIANEQDAHRSSPQRQPWSPTLKSSSEEHRLNRFLFLIKREKYLELLERRDMKQALHVLRNELSHTIPALSPKHHQSTDNGTISKQPPPTNQLHELSSLMMCSSVEVLRERANWLGTEKGSRQKILGELQEYIPNHLIVPERRWEILFKQAVLYQQSQARYPPLVNKGEIVPNPSLLVDYQSEWKSYPSHSTHILESHSDEVWYVSFSHDGRFLASGSKDFSAIIWDTETWKPVHVLMGHEEAVSFVSWSPDDSMLLTCSNDSKLKLWDTTSGVCLRTFVKHADAVTSCAWLPDGQSFVSSSLDKAIYLWNIDGEIRYRWVGARVTDLAITHDGQKMVAVCHEKKIRVYDLEKKTEVCLQEDNSITSLSLSSDSRYALINLSAQEVRVWDLEKQKVVRTYIGQKQGKFVIRSCFAGPESVSIPATGTSDSKARGVGSLVVSGSEDSQLFIWHRESGTLMDSLKGHTGTVNSVSFCHHHVHGDILASASDDCTIRIWAPESP